MKLLTILLMVVSSVVWAEEGDIHFRINGHGVHHHVAPADKKWLNNDVYGFNFGYELPYNFIVGAGVFANSMKDYGHNHGRTSNFFQIENRLYKDESWSFYARYRTANNYYKSFYQIGRAHV